MTRLAPRVPLPESWPCCVLLALIPTLISLLTGGQYQRSPSTSLIFLLPILRCLLFSRYLYYQSFGIDACFRFKRRHISSYEKDPELGPGFAYVVAWEPYNQYLLERANQNEVSGFIYP